MGYTTRSGRYAKTTPHTLVAQEITADGESAAVEVSDARTLRLLLVAEVSGGDPEIDVTIETSHNGQPGTWREIGAFTQLDATAEERILVAPDRFVRAAWDMEGDTSNSEVVQEGDGPAVTITGDAAEDMSGLITITTGGDRGVAEFSWAAGDEDDEAVTTAATVVLGTTGLTANFPEGTYVQDTTYAWTSEDADPGDTTAFLTISGESV